MFITVVALHYTASVLASICSSFNSITLHSVCACKCNYVYRCSSITLYSVGAYKYMFIILVVLHYIASVVASISSSL